MYKSIDLMFLVDGLCITALSTAQLQQVQQLFPQGVCDWTKPSVGDVEHSILWPSIGSTSLENPHQLKWRVGRSGT